MSYTKEVNFTEIDYSKETGPFWYVEVDDTPVLPAMPLPLEHAIAAFRLEVADADEDTTVALVPCDEDSLAWAGVTAQAASEDEESVR